MNRLDKHPKTPSGVLDTSRIVVAVVGPTAFVDDLVKGRRETWKAGRNPSVGFTSHRLIDGLDFHMAGMNEGGVK